MNDWFSWVLIPVVVVGTIGIIVSIYLGRDQRELCWNKYKECIMTDKLNCYEKRRICLGKDV